MRNRDGESWSVYLAILIRFLSCIYLINARRECTQILETVLFTSCMPPVLDDKPRVQVPVPWSTLAEMASLVQAQATWTFLISFLKWIMKLLHATSGATTETEKFIGLELFQEFPTHLCPQPMLLPFDLVDMWLFSLSSAALHSWLASRNPLLLWGPTDLNTASWMRPDLKILQSKIGNLTEQFGYSSNLLLCKDTKSNLHAIITCIRVCSLSLLPFFKHSHQGDNIDSLVNYFACSGRLLAWQGV